MNLYFSCFCLGPVLCVRCASGIVLRSQWASLITWKRTVGRTKSLVLLLAFVLFFAIQLKHSGCQIRVQICSLLGGDDRLDDIGGSSFMVIHGGARVHIISSGARILILHGCTRVLVRQGGPCNPVIDGDWGQPQIGGWPRQGPAVAAKDIGTALRGISAAAHRQDLAVYSLCW